MVGTARVARDEHRRERLASLRMPADVGAAPGERVQEDLVIALRGQVDRLALLDRSGLSRELGRILSLLDHHAAPLAGSDVVAAAVLEGREHFGRWFELDNAGELRLYRRRRLEAVLTHDVSEIQWRLGLDHDASDLGRPRPIDERGDGFGGRGHRPARNVSLAYTAQTAQLHARHRAAREPDALHGPPGARLHLAPSPRLQQR